MSRATVIRMTFAVQRRLASRTLSLLCSQYSVANQFQVKPLFSKIPITSLDKIPLERNYGCSASNGHRRKLSEWSGMYVQSERRRHKIESLSEVNLCSALALGLAGATAYSQTLKNEQVVPHTKILTGSGPHVAGRQISMPTCETHSDLGTSSLDQLFSESRQSGNTRPIMSIRPVANTDIEERSSKTLGHGR